MTHRVAAQRRDRGGILCGVRLSLQRYSNESQAGLGGEIGFGFGNDEAAQRITYGVSCKTALSYH
jgi:hypothetical protein